MTFPPDPHAQRLHDWLEARAAGQVPPTAPDFDPELAELLATAHQLDHLAQRYSASALHNRSARQHSWEDIMPSLSTAAPTVSGPATSSGRYQHPGWTAHLQRWQPAISLALVLALLGGLLAIAWDRQSRDPEPTPTMLAALQDDAGTPYSLDTLNLDPDCVAQDLGAPLQLNGQWNTPDHSLARSWSGEEQLAIYQMFVTYLACQNDRSGDPPSDAERTFLSPRLLFLLGDDEASALFGTNAQNMPGYGGTDLVDPTQRILSDFPLPVNRYGMYNLALFDPEDGSTMPFEYWDIHTFLNGRWAVIGGSISAHMLQTGEPIRTGDGELMYISFIAQGDGYVIDEYFLICPSDIQQSLADDDSGMVTQQDSFDPAELIRNPAATCG